MNLSQQWYELISAQKQRIGLLRLSAAFVFVLSLTMWSTISSAAEVVCAEVKVEITQELTLERQAFDGLMRINNSLDTLALEYVTININFKDEFGNSVLASSDPAATDASFFIKVDSLLNIDTVNGGTILPGTTAEIHWLIIPAPGAAAANPAGKVYFVGADLQYVYGGQQEAVSVAPDFIRVKPLPELTLDYFLTRNVYADDAFTAEIEPAEPFTLGVRIQNNGTGLAENVKINSAQPRIVENEQGLLINFEIIGSYLNEQPTAPSLLIDFGNIDSGAASTGRWLMQTTLSGKFTEFTAQFTHSDELGGQLTSILEAVNAHNLIHDVRVDALGRDNVRDFLANDAGALKVYESDNVDTVVADQSGSSSMAFSRQLGADYFYNLTTTATAGFAYVKLADPYNGTKLVKEVIRADGKRLSVENAWLSKERVDITGWAYFFNLFDQNTSGAYTVVFENETVSPQTPVMQFVPDRTTYETNQVSFLVEASDPNGTVPVLSAINLPAGASFTDQANGSAIFNWIPNIGQAGIYEITYQATDGALTATRKAYIRVNPEWDTDGDGMADSWELEHFGDLSRDGSGDFDGDGISDLQEFLNGTSPVDNLVKDWGAPGYIETDDIGNANTPAIAIADDGSAIAVWSHSDGIRSSIWANHYVPASGWGIATLLETDNVGDAHSPVLAIDVNGQAMAVWLQSDGTRDNLWGNYFVNGTGWGTATLIETDDVGNAAYAQVAMAADGTAVALWSQADGTLDGNNQALPNTIWTSRFVASSGWGTPERIENNSSIHAFGSQLVADGAGNVMALWSDTSDGVTYNISSNHYVSATGWQTAQLIRAGAFGDFDASPVVNAKLAMNANGEAVAVWAEAASPASVWATGYTPVAGWGTAELIESNLDAAIQPAVAIDANGNAIATFAQFDGTRYVIQANRYVAGTGWDSAVLIGTSSITSLNGNAASSKVSVDASGNAMVVWEQFDGVQKNIWSNRFNATDNIWQQAQVIEIENTGDATNAQLAMNSNGAAVVVWQQTNGAISNIQSNNYEPSNTGVPNIAPVPYTAIELTVDEQTTVTLDGGTAFDQDGTIVSYSWLQTGGTVVTLDDSTTATTGIATFTAPILTVAETLFFQLTVTDDENATNTADMAVTVNPVNATPTANAGVDQSVNEQTPVTLTGTATDTDGSIATYVWTQTSGVTVTLTGANMATASFTSPVVLVQDGAQVLSFTLTATDNEGGVIADTVNITVNSVNATPTANAGIDQSVNEQTPITLTGTATDTDGSIASYVWTQTGGVAVTLANANSAIASFTSPVVLVQDSAQVLSFALTATDNEGAVITDAMTVTVNPVNATPTANAGVDQSVNEQTPVTLTGTASDTDGTIATYAWTQTGGVAVTLTSANTAVASFTSPIVLVQDGAQVLNFTLTATDNEGAVITDTMTVTVNPVNATPTANAGVDQSVNEQTPVTLTGTASDTDGSIATYVWTQTGGMAVTLTGANTAVATFTSPIVLAQDGAQVLSFTLTATDNEGSVVTDTVNVTVNPVNATPTTNAGIDQTVNEQTPVTLTGTASDTDGTIATYAWTQTGGVTVALTGADTASASFTSPVVLVQDGAQVLSFTLTATDNEGGVIADTVNITVNPVNAIPTTDAGFDQIVDEQTPVTLTGTAVDTDGTIATYVWTQTSGVAVTLTGAYSATANFTSPVVLVQDGAQVLSFTLTATDNEGAVVTDTMAVTVNPVNAIPTANAGVDQSVNEQTPVTLTGTASDPDGTITTYVWTQTSGVAVTLTGANTATANFTSPVVLVQDGAQVLSFTLTATDNEGAVITDTMTVTVNPVNAAPTANAGLDQSVNEQTPVTLIGTASDTDGTITTYAWTQTGGVAVTLTGAGTAIASFTSPVVLVQDGAQVLSFTLTVTDNEGSVVTDAMTVTVNPVNAAPTANAGIDQSVNEQTPVTLTGTASDTDGSIATYVWTQTGGVAVTLTGAGTAIASFTSPVVLVQDGAQALSFTLTATDNEGAVITDIMTVTVNPVNAAPTADAGVDQIVDEQTPVTLTGTATDTDGNIATYAWTQTGGVAVTLTGADTAVASFSSPIVLVQDGAQVLSFTLTATDNEGAVITDIMTVTVNPVNAAPTADAGVDQIVDEQTPVTLTGTATDTDGTITTYVWTQTSGVAVTLTGADTASANFTSPVVLVQDGAQVLSFTLTATDNEGAVITDAMTVTVNPVNALPTVDAGTDQSKAEGTLVNLMATANDSDGSITSYAWTQLSGPSVILTAVDTANANFTSPLVYQDTSLVFKVIVTDNEGAQATDTITVVVFSTNPDDDADGMDDLWEVGQFGDMSRDGNGDLDGDGFTDYQEYQQGTNPLVFTLPAPTGLKAVADNVQVTLSWLPVNGAVTYNLYWSTSPGVTPNSGTLISNVNSGFVHTGLNNGTDYYYVVTALSSGDESVVSEEVSATPGIRAWHASQRIDSGTVTKSTPQIAVNADGYTVSIWSQFDGVAYSAWVNHRDPQTGWGIAQVIETGNNGNIYNPQVAINDNGNAIAVWEQFDGVTYNVWSNRYDPLNGWSTAERIETNSLDGGVYFFPQVAMDENGNAIAVWQKISGSAVSIWANRYDSVLGWQTAQLLEADDLHHGYEPQVAVDSNGNALAVWEQFDGIRYNIYSNRYDAGTNNWTSTTIIDGGDIGSAYDAQIAMDAQGNAVAVWEQFDGTRYNVWSNYYHATTGWGTANYIEYNANGGSVYFHPQVAVDEQGNAVSVWQQFDGVTVSIWANRLVNGVWGTATVVEPIDYAHSFNPQVAIDADGNAVVVWEQPDDGANTTVFSIWTNRYSIYDGSWLQPRPLETIDTALMLSPQVAMDDYGNAVTIWWASNAILSASDDLATSVPFADAGLDQMGSPRDLITLDASASYDPAGQALSYHWHQLSGIETALDGKSTSTATLQIPNDKNATSMQYILTITNADGITMTDTVIVSIEGQVLINGSGIGNNGQSWHSFLRGLLDVGSNTHMDVQSNINHGRNAGYQKDNLYTKSGGNRKDDGNRNDEDYRKSSDTRKDDDYRKSGVLNSIKF